MPGTYLVELSPGTTRWKLRHIIQGIACSHDIHDHIEENPHVTLFGPFTLKAESSPREILSYIEQAAQYSGPVSFVINGWDFRKGIHGGVVAFRLVPSPDLVILTNTITEKLTSLAECSNTWDRNPERKWFHITIANRLSLPRAREIYHDLNRRQIHSHGCDRKPSRLEEFLAPLVSVILRVTGAGFPVWYPLIFDDGLRIRVLNDDAILGDFDLTVHSWLYGNGALSPVGEAETLQRYRLNRKMEVSEPDRHTPGEIFVISDLHFGHANIIRYCSRPFAAGDPGEMDRVLAANWNYTVLPGDRAYLLGDIRYGPDAKPALEYLHQLSGNPVIIRGNHDDGIPAASGPVSIDYDGLHFLLVHNPDDAPSGTQAWVIHGHLHNNNLRKYPFINFQKKRVNVSAEVVRYRPVSLAEIASLIRNGEANGTRENLPLRPD